MIELDLGIGAGLEESLQYVGLEAERGKYEWGLPALTVALLLKRCIICKDEFDAMEQAALDGDVEHAPSEYILSER